MPIRLRLLAAVGLIVGATCSDATSPTPGLLRTDADAYTATVLSPADVEVRVILTYRNPADTAVALDRCGPNYSYPIFDVSLVARSRADGSGYSRGWACTGAKPLIVAPNTTRTDTITLRGPSAYDNATHRYLGVLAGTFRIAYGGQTSNAFTVSVPPGMAPQ